MSDGFLRFEGDPNFDSNSPLESKIWTRRFPESATNVCVPLLKIPVGESKLPSTELSTPLPID